MSDYPTPYDSLCRWIFGNVRRATSLACDVLSPEIVARVDRRKKGVVRDGTRIKKTMHRRQLDLSLRLSLKPGAPGELDFCNVIAEYKSSRDPNIFLQMLEYNLEDWKEYAGGKAAKLRKLPETYMIVLYLGKEPWDISGSLAEMVSGRQDGQAGPVLDCHLLMVHPHRELKRKNGRRPKRFTDPEVQLALTAMAYIGPGRASKRVIAEVLAAVREGSDLEDLLYNFILRVSKIGEAELMALAKTANPKRGAKKMQSTGDRLIAEGMAKGMAEGMAATLTKLLRLKFRRLPAKAKERIGEASVDELDAWTESILTADSLDEVFAAKPH
ncbi:MAG: Rpn family recombination-promoting nuclease/putative transposase [Pseudomonadales bacterium]